MMTIELFVYVFIVCMMVVCLYFLHKAEIVRKSDKILFYLLLSLIGLQIIITTALLFNSNPPQFPDDNPPISFVCIGTIIVLGLIYLIVIIMKSSTEIQEYTRTATGFAMFIAFGASILGIIVWYPDTIIDLYRMPIALALCIGMQYYPLILIQLVEEKDLPEIELEEQTEAAINTTSEERYEEHEETIIALTTEAWYLAKLFERAILQLNIDQPRRYTSRIEWFLKKAEESLNDVGMRIVNVEGHTYDVGMAAAPANMEEFGVEDALEVTSMVEPIIMKGTDLMKRGKVYLRRTES